MSTKMRACKIAILSIGFIFASISIANAVDSTSITIITYKFTLTNFQISQDSGQTWTTVFSGSKEFNPASVSSGLVDYLAQNYVIPPGTYNYLKINIVGTGRVKFSTVFGGTTYYTNNTVGLTTDSNIYEEVDINWSTTLYEGTISTPIEFADGYRRIARTAFYLSHPYAIASTTDYSSWTLATTLAVAFSEPEAIQMAIDDSTIFYITIRGSSN